MELKFLFIVFLLPMIWLIHLGTKFFGLYRFILQFSQSLIIKHMYTFEHNHKKLKRYEEKYEFIFLLITL